MEPCALAIDQGTTDGFGAWIAVGSRKLDSPHTKPKPHTTALVEDHAPERQADVAIRKSSKHNTN
uniref:Uncharacterized protein n=1 Tax=Anopheles minimus TaxID=112268 RepID=A0A182VT05_9DIPT